MNVFMNFLEVKKTEGGLVIGIAVNTTAASQRNSDEQFAPQSPAPCLASAHKQSTTIPLMSTMDNQMAEDCCILSSLSHVASSLQVFAPAICDASARCEGLSGFGFWPKFTCHLNEPIHSQKQI